ncbi:hypothetical protein DSO57_1036319 [Entomophthora muscae]|uniref:Uncharacterized protein n=1 Tax=Entomophthora muscae TaxID=34485 RepID=A0ACC2RE17_9FUNG|nr:hypothetical protein DSO57_1036319 [Entomophthora muscae]
MYQDAPLHILAGRFSRLVSDPTPVLAEFALYWIPVQPVLVGLAFLFQMLSYNLVALVGMVVSGWKDRLSRGDQQGHQVYWHPRLIGWAAHV